MGLFDFFKRRFSTNTSDSTSQAQTTEQTAQGYEKSLSFAMNAESGGSYEVDVEFPYVSISTSGDERVCKMCKQFEGKLFCTLEAPQLPLHPLCGCVYMFHEKPGRRKIRNPADFVMPASCAPAFSANADAIMRERDIFQRIRLCEEGLAMLEDFLAPYRSAGWNAPEELPCVYRLIDDYMALGKWDKATQTVQVCIAAGAYKQKDGEKQLQWILQVSEASSYALEYLSSNPGTLQRNIYGKLCPPCDREALKWFLSSSMQIRKEKTDKANKLYVADNVFPSLQMDDTQ